MTVALNQSAVLDYLGNDLANEFPITFPTFEKETVLASVADDTGLTTDLAQDVDFTLSSIGIKGMNGKLTLIDNGQDFLTPGGKLAAGFTLFIKFAPQGYQPMRGADWGAFAPERFERTLDRLAMAINAVKAIAANALSLQLGDGGVSPSLPPLHGNAKRVLQVNAAENGFEYGLTADEMSDMVDAAQQARLGAEAARDIAVDARDDAETFKNAAESARDDALAYADTAMLEADDAAESADEAELSAEESEFWSKFIRFSKVVRLSFADSPYTVDDEDDEDTLFLVDTDGGDVVINMPLISATGLLWKIGAMKISPDTNRIQINAGVGNTVNGASNVLVTENGTGRIVYANSPTDWKADFTANAITSSDSGGGAVPPGGALGSVLAKVSATDGDVEWKTYGYVGFSARFNQAVNTENLDETLALILNLQYLGPQVNLSASGSGTIREKGTNVTATTLGANVTKRSNNIARIQFFKDGVAIAGADYNPPSNVGSGTTSHNWTGSFNDNATFRVDVTDEIVSGTGPTTVSSSVTFNFVYPYFYGCGAPGLSASLVAALTKDVIASNPTLSRTFTAAPGQVFYFAYPQAYGALAQIQDENGFDVTGNFNRREENITGLDGSAQPYYIYEYLTPSSGVTTNFTFRR